MGTARMWALLAVLVMLAGCAGDSAFTVASTQSWGNARVTLDRDDPRILVVSLLNTRDIGYDFNDPGVRRGLIARMLTDQCGTPSILETRVTRTGQIGVRQYQVFTLTVHCPNGASQVLADG